MENTEKKILVSIVIRCKNEEKFIGKVLENIWRQERDFDIEVIIIDSGSKDRTLEIARKFPVRVYQISPEKFIYGYALNIGTNLAKGEYVVFLSAHVIPKDTLWLKKLVFPLKENENIIATYGKQESISRLNPFEEMELKEWFSSKNIPPKVIFSNANCCIKKKILYQFPFDEKIPFGEDRLWALSIPKNLKILYVPNASVYHSHPFKWKYWLKRWYLDGISKAYIEKTIKEPLSNKKFSILNYCFYCFQLFTYLISHKYFFCIIEFPVYIVAKPIFYLFGKFSYKFFKKMI